MHRHFNNYIRFLLFLTLSSLGFTFQSQAQTPTYEMYITNQLQVDSKTYQFDVYVLSTGTAVLEMANIQLGIGIDTSIANGGVLSVSLDSGSSQLVAAQVPTNIVLGVTSFTVNGVVYRSINQSARIGPGTGNGTIISKIKNGCSSPGTRIGTYRLKNTKDFKISSLTKHIFNTTAGTQRVATAVSCYVNGVNTVAIGTFYNYNTNGTCDQNLILNDCQISASVSTTPVVYYGESTGTATITLTGAGTSSSGTYRLDGDSAIAFTTNPFVINGLSAGTHNVTISSGLCEVNTGNFTIEGIALGQVLSPPRMPSFVEVLTISTNPNWISLRFNAVENLPQATQTTAAATGWNWQITGNLKLGENVFIDSGNLNSKKVRLTILKNRITSPCDNIKVCYTSSVGNSPYQTPKSNLLNFKSMPTPTHIVVEALDISPDGYRRYRYSAPDSVPVETDSIIQPTGWYWNFIGNLSQNMIIDSGNYNSKKNIVKLTSNDPEGIEDNIKLAYLSNCGIGNFFTSRFTRKTGHKYIFDNHCNDGLGIDWQTGDWINGYSIYWNNPNNWDEYPGTHLFYGDTVIMKDYNFCYINIQNSFDHGSVVILEPGIGTYLESESDLISNGKFIIPPSGTINLASSIYGNYLIENNGYFFTPKNNGIIINNGYFSVEDNFGTIINNYQEEMPYYISNYGTIVNNGNTVFNNSTNSGSIINNKVLSLNSINNIGVIINNDSLFLSGLNNYGQFINNDSIFLNGFFENYSDSLVLTNSIFMNENSYIINYNKIINRGNLELNGTIQNSDFFQSQYTGLSENCKFINEIDGRINGVGSIFNQGIGINKGELKCSYIENDKVFINEYQGVIEGGISNFNYQRDSSQNIFENRGIINFPSNNGWFYNYFATFKNYGTLNNYSSWAWEQNSYFINYGTLNNYTEYYPSHTFNYGVINNDSTINLFNEYDQNSTPRTIDNYSIINNNGAIIGSGNINNINGITINNGIVSPGSTRNANIDTLNNIATSRSITNIIPPSSSSESFKIGSLTFSDFTGTPTFEIEIADTNSITGHDFVTINDTLNAGGTINLSISYLPNPNDEITIIHADTVMNQFDTVNIPSGWSLLYNHPNKGDISVKYDKTNLNVKAFLEGYCLGNSTMNSLLYNVGLSDDVTAVDSIEVQMWSPDHLYFSEPNYSSKVILHNDGNANLSLPINMLDNSYYICIKHKNSIQTWSSEPITISTNNNYDFTVGQDQAYSNNLNNPMKLMPDGSFAIYSGDLNQDGTIDIFDMMSAENDASNFNFGYNISDCNGDGSTDIVDMQLIENNFGFFIFYSSPR